MRRDSSESVRSGRIYQPISQSSKIASWHATKGTEWPQGDALHHLQCAEGPYSHQHTAKHPYTWNSRILSTERISLATWSPGPCFVICATNCSRASRTNPSNLSSRAIHPVDSTSSSNACPKILLILGLLLTSLDSFYVTGETSCRSYNLACWTMPTRDLMYKYSV